MLHCSNAESPLWKGQRSPGTVPGQSRNPARRRAGAGTWPEAVFESVPGPPAGREDLLESLQNSRGMRAAA